MSNIDDELAEYGDGPWEWRAIVKQTKVLCFYAREFEGADLSAGEHPELYGINTRQAAMAAATRAKLECEQLQRQLVDYHKFITKVIEKGKP